jgi:ABC-type polysaccharide/polyol phosphate transport system ATPase subunit
VTFQLSNRPIITADNLGKAYKLGLAQEKYPTFREAIMGAVRAPIRRFRQLSNRSGGDETFWALRDVSFDVQRGEVVGIIGRNGAGKSTLLKILSRITEPTTGRAILRGRVASLLEVGTGFHPELTGRENVYLNGSILGMKKAEIDRNFDEIVTFAEVEKFLDTPVKRYSSGMYVRLAFAVAAHLEPEILVVDEVLAVGDAEFQKKCLGKMHDVSEHEGRTVLFVSHNMGAIRSLCATCLHFDRGALFKTGPTDDVVMEYLKGSGHDTESTSHVIIGNSFEFLRIQFASPGGNPLLPLEPAIIDVDVRVLRLIEDVGVRIDILDEYGNLLMGIPSWLIRRGGRFDRDEVVRFSFQMSALPFTPGLVRVGVHLQDHGNFKSWGVPGAFEFTVVEQLPFVGRRGERARVGPIASDVSLSIVRNVGHSTLI